jgi:hypothetical protein
MANSEDSLYRAIGTFETLANGLRNQPGYQMAKGLALLAEGLHAKIQKMDTRLTAIEAALPKQPSR